MRAHAPDLPLSLSLLSVVCAGALPSAAHATTYCVAKPTCAAVPGNAKAATLKAAIDAAAANAGQDRVELGAGTFPFPGQVPKVESTNDVASITGMGEGVTHIQPSGQPERARRRPRRHGRLRPHRRRGRRPERQRDHHRGARRHRQARHRRGPRHRRRRRPGRPLRRARDDRHRRPRRADRRPRRALRPQGQPRRRDDRRRRLVLRPDARLRRRRPGPTDVVTADPGLVNAAGGNYALKATSPLVDRGEAVLPAGGADLDLAGVARKLDGNGDGIARTDIGAPAGPPPVTGTGTATRVDHLTLTAVRQPLDGKGRFALRAVCDAAGGCRGKVRLTATVGKRRVVLGTTSVTLADGARATLRVTLSRAARRALATRKTLQVRAAATVHAGSGAALPATAAFAGRSATKAKH